MKQYCNAQIEKNRTEEEKRAAKRGGQNKTESSENGATD